MNRARILSPERSIRTRLTLISTVTLLLGLIIGAFAFDRLLSNQLTNNLDQQLSSQALDRARAIDAGLDPTSQLETVQSETAVAVFGTDGTLLANRGFDNPFQVVDLAPGVPTTQAIDLFEADENETERYDLRVVAATEAATTVVVASELDPITEPLGAARKLIAVGVPLLTLAGAALLWLVSGRSLQPVEELRLDAQAIADGTVGGRVREPESDDEIGRLAATLNDMLDRLERSADTLRQFVSDSSHEIRSPIANIRARVETGTSSDWPAVQSNVVAEVERVEGIVNDLTFLARSDEGESTHHPQRVELDAVLFAEAARLQQRGRVTVDAASIEPIVITADDAQIKRLVRNLVDNAERHAVSVVRLAVTEASEEGATITVEDDGLGIPARDREKIFERFARLDESRDRKSGGTGLGLAIVRDIALRHDGTVTVEVSDLGGARFTVSIPN